MRVCVWGGSVRVLCYLLWGFMGCLCGFSKYEFEFKVVLCLCVDCSAPYQQCRQHTSCVCVCMYVCLISDAVTCRVCVITEDLHGQKSRERSEWPWENNIGTHRPTVSNTLSPPICTPYTVTNTHNQYVIFFNSVFHTCSCTHNLDAEWHVLSR